MQNVAFVNVSLDSNNQFSVAMRTEDFKLVARVEMEHGVTDEHPMEIRWLALDAIQEAIKDGIEPTYRKEYSYANGQFVPAYA